VGPKPVSRKKYVLSMEWPDGGVTGNLLDAAEKFRRMKPRAVVQSAYAEAKKKKSEEKPVDDVLTGEDYGSF
jgi:hypothetical protein